MPPERNYDCTKVCRQDGCEASTQADRFNAIRAAEAGWFFSREGWATCPAHQPEWLADWRAKKGST